MDDDFDLCDNCGGEFDADELCGGLCDDCQAEADEE